MQLCVYSYLHAQWHYNTYTQSNCLPQVALPCHAKYCELVLFKKEYFHQLSEVSLTIDAQIQEQELTIVWLVDVRLWRLYGHLWEHVITCKYDVMI